MHETYHQIALRRRLQRLQKETNNWSHCSKVYYSLARKEILLQAVVCPCKILVSPIVLLMILYMADIYDYLHPLFTTLITAYEEEPHSTDDVAGL
jgi:hypothetical protein